MEAVLIGRSVLEEVFLSSETRNLLFRWILWSLTYNYICSFFKKRMDIEKKLLSREVN